MTIKITAKLHFLFGTAKWNGILFTELYTGADENVVIVGRLDFCDRQQFLQIIHFLPKVNKKIAKCQSE